MWLCFHNNSQYPQKIKSNIIPDYEQNQILTTRIAVRSNSPVAHFLPDDDDPTPKPGKNQWALTIDGKTTKYEVKSAGFFHSENRGYNFLFCDENVDIKADMFQPECNWLRIDIPEEIIDQTIKNPSELNGADWDFEY